MCTPVTFVRLFAMGALLSCFSADLIKPRGGFLSSSCVSYCFFFINTSFIFNSTPKFLQMQWEKSDKSIQIRNLTLQESLHRRRPYVTGQCRPIEQLDWQPHLRQEAQNFLVLCRQLSASERHGIVGVCAPEWQEYLTPPPGHLTRSPQKLAFLTVED